MPISLVTNFYINTEQPIDSRIIASSSSIREAISYKYDGLSVFQTDTRQSWIWNSNSATWSYNVAGNGIYGGSGSLVGNTYVNFGSVDSTISSTSSIFGYYSTAGSNTVYLNNYLRRTAADSTYQSLSFRLQLLADSTPSSYIEFNPDYTDYGAFSIGTNNVERIRVNSNGKVGVLMTSYNQASFMVNGIASSEGIYISPDNSNTAAVGGGYAILVDTSGSLKIRDTSPNSPDYVNSLTPGYQILNIIGGKMLIGGTTSVSSYTPESRLEVYEPNLLGTTTGNSILLKTITQNPQGAGTGNSVKIREWALRDKSTYTANDWYSWRYHNGISVDFSFGNPTSTTRTFWERDIATERQFFGSSGVKTIEIQSQSGSTHSLLIRNNSSNKTFKWNDKYKVTYLDDSSTFIVEGFNRNINSTLSTPIVTFSGSSFPANSLIIIEVEFSSLLTRNSGLSALYYNRQNAIRAVYEVAAYTITTNLSDQDIYDYSTNTGGYISKGNTSTDGNNIYINQNGTSGNYFLNAKWKMTIAPKPLSPFSILYSPSGNTSLNINGLI
jgi:hypothetical protein